MKNPINKPQIRVLLEMRPALDGFAGIPQETRLLFRGLQMLDGVQTEGMIQTSDRTLARGTAIKPTRFSRLSSAKRMNRYSRVIVSLAEKPYRTLIDEILNYVEKRLATTALSLRSSTGFGRVKLTQFQARDFTDFTWRTMFAKTLPASDFELVSGVDYRICSVPWHTMHMAGLKSMSILPNPSYARLETADVDVFIAQTPYPARIDPKTAFVVRYHDAIPVLMPHTIPDKSLHQATHFYALSSNVKSGAYFACVSEATRQDLLRLFPEVEDRAVTIYNMVSHHYYKEEARPDRVPDIIRGRLYESDAVKGVELRPKFFTLREQEGFYRRVLTEKPLKYLLVVSTIEPRKNHTRLLAAWEVLKAEVDPDIKLVIVGTIGWDYMSIVKGFRSWIDRGELFMLNAVPAPDLRVLYRNAVATVCPSLGEGFDFSGVEAMRSNGVVIASDIPVHMEVYEDAAEYFDPYSTASLVKALKNVLYTPESAERRACLRERGQAVSERYLPDNVLPQWQQFIENVAANRAGRSANVASLPSPTTARSTVEAS